MSQPKPVRPGSLLRSLFKEFLAFFARLGRRRGVALVAILLAMLLALGLHQLSTHLLASPRWVQSYQARVTLGQRTVAIGGGGAVTGIYIHPKQKDLVYIRTDVGGFYRWSPGQNPERSEWIPLTDQFNRQQLNYYGGESLALDPTNPQVVYVAVGKSHWFGPGTLLKSTDQGKTWTKLPLDLPLLEDYRRWTGERLAVNPHRPQELLFGSWKSGLWRSPDAGRTWQAVPFPMAKKDGNIAAIAFDPNRRGRVYAYVDEEGLYQSTDAGRTWTAMPNSPKQVMRLAIARDGQLYTVGYGAPWVSRFEGQPAQAQLATGTNQWRDISPPASLAESQGVYGAIAVNPQNGQDLIVSRGEVPNPAQFRSRDGGSTWQPLPRTTRSTVPWWTDFMRETAWIAAMEFDPHHRDRAWLVDWYGIWRTDNLNATKPTWTNLQQGHEEVVVFALAAPPKGPLLLSGVADVDGFAHAQGLDAFPAKSFSTTGPHFQDTYSIAYSETQPQRMVRVGGDRSNGVYGGATSRDGGLSWTAFANFPKDQRPIRVAMSATDPNLFVVIVHRAQPLRTTDGGKTWKPVQGLPDGPKGPWTTAPRSLVADPVAGQTFYYYTDGKLYRSTDGGASFSVQTEQLSWIDWHTLQAQPDRSGDLWLALEDEGLRHSTDGGKTFTQLPTVEEAYLFDFGKAAPGQRTPAMYLYGKVKGQGEGAFRSLDLGKSWQFIGDRQRPMGNFPSILVASRQRYGLVFVGTHGRGIYYGSVE
jgi:xyloglucan-specific exo-beta-1,4-glucanase